MCENPVPVCANCGADRDALRYEEHVCGTRTYDLDEDGDPNWDTGDTSMCDSDGSDGHIYCSSCGEETSIEHRGEDGCECEECIEPDAEDGWDSPPDVSERSFAILARTSNDRCDLTGAPVEVQQLFMRRSIHRIAIPQTRFEELWADGLSNEFPVRWDVTSEVPPSLIALHERNNPDQMQMEAA